MDDPQTLVEMPEDDLDRLTRGLMEGNADSLGTILRRFGPIVLAGLRRRYSTMDQQDLEDVLSIALFRLWNARETFDPARSSLRTFYYRIADNAARDVFRYGWHKAKMREVPLEPAQYIIVSGRQPPRQEEKGDPSIDDESPADVRRKAALRQILDQLPEPYRRILLADAFAKDRVASSQHLAQELNISEVTVRVYRKRALAAVRNGLIQQGLEPE